MGFVVKIRFGPIIRRFRIESASFDVLNERITATFGNSLATLAMRGVHLVYRDPENQLIAVDTNEELQEMVAVSGSSSDTILRFMLLTHAELGIAQQCTDDPFWTPHPAPVVVDDSVVEEVKVVQAQAVWNSPLSARFVTDVTILDGEELKPETKYLKTWRMKNDGASPWPANIGISNVGGDKVTESEHICLQNAVVFPGDTLDVTIEITTPTKERRYISYWRLCESGRTLFGHRVWVDFRVVAWESAVPPAAPPAPAQAVVSKTVQFTPLPAPASAGAALCTSVRGGEDKKEYIYAEQLQSLREMGFSDDENLSKYLDKHHGDISATVRDLIGVYEQEF